MRIAEIDLTAARENIERVRALAEVETVIAVVKANGYGHGAVDVSRAFLAGGASMLGVADVSEALELRAAGITAPVLAWLHDSSTDFAAAIRGDIELGVSSLEQFDRLRVAARAAGRVARVHLKIETGLGRGGVRAEHWTQLVREAVAAEHAGEVSISGVFSHLANVSAADNRRQAARFADAVQVARDAGLEPSLIHLAASEAALTDPELRLNAVRVGIALYGLSATGEPAATWGLRPVMTLRSTVSLVNDLPAGAGVSYGHDWVAEAATRIALVPVGYADGLPRAASGRAEVAIAGARFPVRGRIAMDQIIVEIGDAAVEVGDEVVLWGDPETGAPSADDWAAWAGTIGYEVVTKVGRRVRVQVRDER